MSFLKWLNITIQELQPDIVVNLGDTFDTHAVTRSEIMTEFRHHVDFVMDNTDAQYLYILGNHDTYKPNDSKYHALKPMMGIHERFRVIEKRFDLDNITFVPYIHNPANFPKDTKEICVAHQTFIGADYGYMRPEDGVDPELVCAELIISGHIHKRQNFGKVYYPGTPFAQDAKDMDQIKGIILLETTSYEQVFIPSPLPKWRHLAYIISPELSLEDIHLDIAANINVVDHWVLELTGTKTEIMGYLNSKKYLEAIKGVDIKPKHNFIDKDKRKIKIDSLSMETIFAQYIDKVYSGNLDKNKLKNIALEVLNETRQQGLKSKM
jgi:DNA repair exonuclease SbcCD nuclease subunit